MYCKVRSLEKGYLHRASLLWVPDYLLDARHINVEHSGHLSQRPKPIIVANLVIGSDSPVAEVFVVLIEVARGSVL